MTHDRSLSLLRTVTSIKSGGVRPVLWLISFFNINIYIMELLKTDPFWKPTQWRRRSIWYNWTELPDVGSLLISTCVSLANLIRLSTLQMMYRRTNETSIFGSGRTWGYTWQRTIILVIYQMSDFGLDNRLISFHHRGLLGM